MLAGIFYIARLATRTRIPVRTAVVSRSELSASVSTNGRVEPEFNFEAHAPVAGLVKKRYVVEGQKVTKGELLITMDDSDARAKVAAALASVRAAQASYSDMQRGGTQEERLSLGGDVNRSATDRDQAQRDLDTLKKLQMTGSASANEVAAAQQRLDQANASLNLLHQRTTGRYSTGDLARAKSTLDEAQAGYEAAKTVLDQTSVRAPFDGTVYSVPVSATDYVQPGTTLLEMADLSKMRVHGYFDEPEIGKLRVGQPITVEWDAKPGKTWHGSILRVPSNIILFGTTRNVGEVIIAVNDADDDLLPNTNVRVKVTTSSEKSALNIPREALHSERGDSYVYRVANGTLHRVPVRVGNINLTQVEILSGLNDGDVVALGSTTGQPIGDRAPVVEAK
ncbi:efflux RND transporter periplasmic adaptor subunit [Silvibacterium acidisoli]|uniref:efflux RND transporter periplasmic adaptor subunit n=1 Tax=Acidobacteriaceae bacterium ZG23-2 TaxID=2883246 RepID=UPI00406C41AE